MGKTNMEKIKQYLAQNKISATFFLILTTITTILTYFLVSIQSQIGVYYWDIFFYLNNALKMAGMGVGDTLYLSPFLPLVTSLFFRAGLVHESTLFVISGVFYLLGTLEETFGLPVVAPQHAEVANAIGACLTRPTQSLVLTVDTSRGSFTVPGLGIHKAVKRTYTLEEAVHDATTMLRAELDRQGIPAEEGDIQVIQADAFNMVEGHYTIGRNIRVRCQMRPGVITTLAS